MHDNVDYIKIWMLCSWYGTFWYLYKW